MAKFKKPTPSQSINLVYIRAAIEANTGVSLSLEEVRELLVEEGLITRSQATKYAQIFRGYGEFYDTDDYSVSTDSELTRSNLTDLL